MSATTDGAPAATDIGGTEHRLVGLEPDNLLAFLALLGLLRALEMARPEWQPKAYWNFDVAPLRPTLTTRCETRRDQICKAAVEGLHVFRDALRPFSWPRSKEGAARKTALFSSEARQGALARRCIAAAASAPHASRSRTIWQLRCDLIACAGGFRINSRKKVRETQATPLKLPSAQMAFVGAQFELAKRCASNDIDASLFNAWTYAARGNSLRLSPDEAQRYAYRASDPQPEGSWTELGASALSGLGLLSFTISEAQAGWIMVGYVGNRSEGTIVWPIWKSDGGTGASLHSINALLRSIDAERLTMEVADDVHFIASARRFILNPATGDYGNVSRARLNTVATDEKA